MTLRTRLIIRGCILLAFFLGLNAVAQHPVAQQSLFTYNKPGDNTVPLVLVVHGVGSNPLDGSGNRPDGWSDDTAKAWGVPIQEITFRYPDRTVGQSFTDLGYKAGEWALSVQSQIQAAIRANPGRRVMVVAHSWGSVATKLAFGGGAAVGYPDIHPIEGVTIDEWVTIGSPIGSNLHRPGVGVVFPDGRPAGVTHWTNFYDPDDAVSEFSHNLPGAENVEVTGSARWSVSWWPYTSPHVGIWTNPRVRSWLRARVDELQIPLPRMKTMEEIAAENRRQRPDPAKPQPNQQAVAKCESDYQEQVSQITANTQWNYSGLASWSDGCPAAESRFTACYEQTCKLYRDSGIGNDCTEKCRDSYRLACTAENLGSAATRRDQCVARSR